MIQLLLVDTLKYKHSQIEPTNIDKGKRGHSMTCNPHTPDLRFDNQDNKDDSQFDDAEAVAMPGIDISDLKLRRSKRNICKPLRFTE